MEEFDNQHVSKPMSVTDWLITLIIVAIPLVGFIMLFVYAFGGNENISRKNWAKAQLILIAIVLVLVLVLFFVFGVSIASIAADADQY